MRKEQRPSWTPTLEVREHRSHALKKDKDSEREKGLTTLLWAGLADPDFRVPGENRNFGRSKIAHPDKGGFSRKLCSNGLIAESVRLRTQAPLHRTSGVHPVRLRRRRLRESAGNGMRTRRIRSSCSDLKCARWNALKAVQ